MNFGVECFFAKGWNKEGGSRQKKPYSGGDIKCRLVSLASRAKEITYSDRGRLCTQAQGKATQ